MAPRSTTKPDRRAAARFRGTRAAHSTEIREDYVEAIDELVALARDGEGARVTDLAKMMGVSHVTVVRTVSRLATAGLVVSRRGKPITLTEKGRELAARTKARHDAVLSFLLAIGVPPEQAAIDAEGIEHHVSEATVRAMERVRHRILAPRS